MVYDLKIDNLRKCNVFSTIVFKVNVGITPKYAFYLQKGWAVIKKQ